MKQKLNIHYDKKGDFLEVHIGKFTEGYFRNLGNGVFERVDKKTNKVTGIAIMGFRKRTEKKDIELSLPIPLEVVS
jgi:hypothetical protein